jgi:hypothetical protein
MVVESEVRKKNGLGNFIKDYLQKYGDKELVAHNADLTSGHRNLNVLKLKILDSRSS